MASNERHGAWLQTFTGRQAWPESARPEDIVLDDVAHQLALINRFLGATRVPYSVAEHSVRAERWVEKTFRQRYAATMESFEERLRRVRLAALVHDVSEYVFGDLAAPVKHRNPMSWYRDSEERFQQVVEAWAGLELGAIDWQIVKEADLTMLATEARDLLAPPPAAWGRLPPPDAEVIVPWDWRHAEREFREAFERLRVAEGPVRLAHFHHCPGCYHSAPCREDCTIVDELSENGVGTGYHSPCSDACRRVIAERDGERDGTVSASTG